MILTTSQRAVLAVLESLKYSSATARELWTKDWFLRRMASAGLVERADVSDLARAYRITPAGRKALARRPDPDAGLELNDEVARRLSEAPESIVSSEEMRKLLGL